MLLDAVDSGDPYLTFAKMAGLAPDDATKQTHGQLRDLCKIALLGTNYGMGAASLAARTGTTTIRAESLLDQLAAVFPVFWSWAEHEVDAATLRGRMSTVFGWPLRLSADARTTALRNWPMQSHGAEMLRLACCLATERGVQVCAPVHDVLLIEAAKDELDQAISITRGAMAQASVAVLSGILVDTDTKIVTWPGRYSDPRGTVMWRKVLDLLRHRRRSEVGEVGEVR